MKENTKKELNIMKEVLVDLLDSLNKIEDVEDKDCKETEEDEEDEWEKEEELEYYVEKSKRISHKDMAKKLLNAHNKGFNFNGNLGVTYGGRYIFDLCIDKEIYDDLYNESMEE